MTFLNPAGLWLLLGIPVLIIIYLIKNQHEDKAVSSTYIWKLSEKFAKKRLPIQRLRKILLFLLQLLIVAAFSLMAAQPAVVSGESYDYIAVIDSSASMHQTDEDGISRFEHALEQVEELAEDLKGGHTISVIMATDSPFCLVEGCESVSEVKNSLNKAVCTYGVCNDVSAMELAEEICKRTENPKVMFYTDKSYDKAGNITVVPMGVDMWNVAVEGLTVENVDKNTLFKATVISCNKDASIPIGLRIDGKTVDAQIIQCESGVEQTVEFVIEENLSFDVAEVYVESEDGLDEDNFYAYCKVNNKKYNVLLVSTSPLYLESAFKAIGNCNIKVEYNVENAPTTGWDLYIYDGIYPESYPTDGSVIVFGAGFLPQGLTAGAKQKTTSAFVVNRQANTDICKDIVFKGAAVNEYTALIGSNEWDHLLYCNNLAVLSTREMDSGTQFSVFSFDLHNSNLPLKADFLLLMKNLVEYSLPSMMKKTDYNAGEGVKIDILPFAEHLYLEYPDERVRELYIDGESCTFIADAVGIYTAATITSKGGEYVDFFVHIKKGETTVSEGGAISVSIEEAGEAVKEDVYSPVWFWVALAALLVLFIEWGVYYSEQY